MYDNHKSINTGQSLTTFQLFVKLLALFTFTIPRARASPLTLVCSCLPHERIKINDFDVFESAVGHDESPRLSRRIQLNNDASIIGAFCARLFLFTLRSDCRARRTTRVRKQKTNVMKSDINRSDFTVVTVKHGPRAHLNNYKRMTRTLRNTIIILSTLVLIYDLGDNVVVVGGV